MLLSIDWGQAIIRPSHVRGVQAVISEGTSMAVIVTFAKREAKTFCCPPIKQLKSTKRGTVALSQGAIVFRRTHGWPLARACISLYAMPFITCNALRTESHTAL